MSKFSAHLMVLSNLVVVARDLHERGIPDCSEYGDNHWTASKEEMELYLLRDLNDEEVTLLSLSRAFGPTPAFSDDDDARTVTRRLWPKGNPEGLHYTWEQLMEELVAFRDSNDNAVFVHASGLRGVYIVELREEPGHGYLAEECGDNAWFGDQECPSSYEMPVIGWFGPDEGWDDAEAAIRSLNGYEVDRLMLANVVRFQLLWDQGRMEEAEMFSTGWHSDAFAAQLWKGVTPTDAWDRAVAALYKLRAVTNDLPDCSEQPRVRDALEAMGLPRD